MGRTDRWDAELTEQQRWAIYENSLRFNYPVLVDWLQKEYTLSEVPSKTAFYNWKSAMRRDEANYRRRKLVEAKIELADLASVKAVPKDMADALVSLGCEAALSNDLDAAKLLVDMAAKISDDSRRSELLRRDTKAEKELTSARAEIAVLKKQMAALRGELDSAHQSTIADPVKVSEAIDKHLGLKPNG